MSANQAILDDLILHISPDKFYVESLTFTKSVLVIDRIFYEISLQAGNGALPRGHHQEGQARCSPGIVFCGC